MVVGCARRGSMRGSSSVSSTCRTRGARELVFTSTLDLNQSLCFYYMHALPQPFLHSTVQHSTGPPGAQSESVMIFILGKIVPRLGFVRTRSRPLPFIHLFTHFFVFQKFPSESEMPFSSVQFSPPGTYRSGAIIS